MAIMQFYAKICTYLLIGSYALSTSHSNCIENTPVTSIQGFILLDALYSMLLYWTESREYDATYYSSIVHQVCSARTVSDTPTTGWVYYTNEK